MICLKCEKEFKLTKTYKNDGLCGRCRSSKKFLEESKLGTYKKTKSCPECGNPILITSNFCYSCVQKGTRNRIYKNGNACKDRKCSCGNYISSGSKKGMCQECYNKTLKGETNPNYKNGHYLGGFRNSSKYKKWRLSVFRRDGFTCKKCGEDRSGFLQAHHIYPQRDFHELVYNINNGITLCIECHKKVSLDEYKYVNYFKSLIMAKVKLCELGEPCDGNTEPSQFILEGVTTRGEINSSKSAGQPLQ